MKIKVPIAVLQSILHKALIKIGYIGQDAEVITDTIMYAELRGNNQGIVKLVSGALKPTSPIIEAITAVHETPVSARLNGKQRSGMVCMSTAVNTALEKAKSVGVGIVGVSNYASATGALGHWANKIARADMIGIVMSQCNELMAPHGSFEPIFGTNPIAFGIPTKPRPQVFDMATSASAYFGLVTAKEEGRNIPDDIAYDKDGNATTSPEDAMRGALRVFDRSFKGSHLALMVELLAGAWTGASMSEKHSTNNWGSLVIVMDPKILGPLDEFQISAQTMCNRVKNAKRLPAMKDQEIFLPGERGDALAEHHLREGVIEISESIYQKLLEITM